MLTYLLLIMFYSVSIQSSESSFKTVGDAESSFADLCFDSEQQGVAAVDPMIHYVQQHPCSAYWYAYCLYMDYISHNGIKHSVCTCAITYTAWL